MKYWNKSQPTTIPSELLTDASFDTTGPRPETVTLPPYAVVDIKPEYGLRRRAEGAGTHRESVVHELSGGKLVPYDSEAQELFATMRQDQLPHVMLEFAKRATGDEGVSTAPDDKATRERKINEEFGRRARAALGEREEATKPKAKPVFVIDER